MKRTIIVVVILAALMGSCLKLECSSLFDLAEPRNGNETTAYETGMDGARDNEPVTFTNVSKVVGLSGLSGNHFAWGDYNNDGYQDLLVGVRLFENNGPPGWNFTEVTGAVGLGGGGNGVWADYDNDGNPDLYTTANRLWRNTGGPDYEFTDMTMHAGNLTDPYPTMAAGWGDYDRDGDLDLYVVNGEDYNGGNTIFYPDIFYENNGDGTFTDMTVETGLDTSNKKAYGRSVNWGDYNNDGWIDIHVGNYRLCPNYLWRNNHDGTFTDVAGETGTKGDYDPERYYDAAAAAEYGDGTWGPTYGHTIGSAWGDLDNDGNLDLWDSNLVHKYIGPTSWPTMPYDIRGYVCDDSKIYRNNGAPGFNFTDVREISGIPHRPIGGSGTYNGDELWSGVAMGDYDNDGDLDVFVPQIYDLNYAFSVLYRNNDDGTFSEMAGPLGLRTFNTYGGCWCDYNNDGLIDLIAGGGIWNNQASDVQNYEIRLYRNNGNSNNWIQVKLTGIGNNHDGIGARVKVTSGGQSQIRELEGGMGAQGHQNSIPVEFGLGSKNSIDAVEVVWPDGSVQRVLNPGINQILEITESNGPVITDIGVSDNDVNEGDPLSFSGQGTVPHGSISKYEWDFEGDGIYDWSSTTTASTQHSYREQGDYYAKLRIWDDTGLLGDAESTDPITVLNVIPEAVLSGDVGGFEEQEIHFSGNASTDSLNDRDSLEYILDFGDGNSTGWVNDTEYSHVYPDMGTYTVNLTVKDDDGATSLDSLTVTIDNRIPSPRIFAEGSGSEDDVIDISATCHDTEGDLDHLEYSWDFGDDEETEFSLLNYTSHSYTEKGIYEVTLKVKDRHDTLNSTTHSINISNVMPTCTSQENAVGVEDMTIVFSGEGFDTGSDESSLEYQWDFGDGFFSYWMDEAYAEHTYTQAGDYEAVLTVKDDDSDTGNCSVNVTVENVIPTGKLSIPQEIVYEDDVVTFSGYGEDRKSDEDELVFRLFFGDGNGTSWQEEAEFSHVYNRSGTYKVVFEIMDNSNATWNTSKYLSVLNRAPVAGFIFYPKKDLDETTEITFDASGSTDTESDMAGLNYTWEMGKGSKIFGKKVIHTFTASGKHTVKLTVKDDDGQFSSVSQAISIENVRPTAIINVSTLRVKVGDRVVFDGSSSTDTPGDMAGLSYEWKIGTYRASEMITEYEFKTPGTFSVYLTVTDEDGDSDEKMLKITVLGKDESEKKTGSLGAAAWIGITLFIVIVMIVIGIFAVIILRKKKNTEEVEGEEGTYDEMKFIFSEGRRNAEDVTPPEVSIANSPHTISHGGEVRSLPLTDESYPDRIGGTAALLDKSPPVRCDAPSGVSIPTSSDTSIQREMLALPPAAASTEETHTQPAASTEETHTQPDTSTEETHMQAGASAEETHMQAGASAEQTLSQADTTPIPLQVDLHALPPLVQDGGTAPIAERTQEPGVVEPGLKEETHTVPTALPPAAIQQAGSEIGSIRKVVRRKIVKKVQ